MKKRSEITDPFSKLTNENPFNVPANYFEEFNGKLKNRLINTTYKDRVKPGNYKISKYGWAMAAAAVIAGLLLAVKVWIIDPSGNEVREDEIAVLLQQEFYDLDEYEMESNISRSYSNTQETGSYENDSYRNEIINYLVDEEVDFETIVSEL